MNKTLETCLNTCNCQYAVSKRSFSTTNYHTKNVIYTRVILCRLVEKLKVRNRLLHYRHGAQNESMPIQSTEM